MKKFLRLLLVFAVFIGSAMVFTGCSDDLILVTGVDLYTNEIYVDVNESVDLSYKVYPSNATNKKVTFWSTDENIASVDENGKVTMKNEGQVSIVVRSVDGGFEDYCKITTKIDPETIEWQTDDKVVANSSTTNYSATASIAKGQALKLKVKFLIDGKEDETVTNKSLTFTSSNENNIKVINETEGIIKAYNNEIVEGDKAFSDITATLKVKSGELKITCRVYVNEYSSLSNLYLNTVDGDTKILKDRNGSETIYLTADDGNIPGANVSLASYILNFENQIKTDYEMNVESSSSNLFEIKDSSNENGVYRFTLDPGKQEGTGVLYISTSCSDENGKTIRCSINVIVQSQIKSVKASATTRKDGETEVILNDEIFSINLDYLKKDGETKIEGVEREIKFTEFSSDPDFEVYLSNYGNNQFKVKKVPTDRNTTFSVKGYILKDSNKADEEENRIDFTYQFYIRNALEALIVSDKDTAEIPTKGISSVTVPAGGSVNLYAYATAYDFTATQPMKVNYTTSDNHLISVNQALSEENEFTINATDKQGDARIVFYATDGITTIEYEVVVHVVSAVVIIEFYDGNTKVEPDTNDETYKLETSNNSTKVYIKIVESAGFKIDSPDNLALTVEGGILKTEITGNTVSRYVEIDLTDEAEKTITVMVDKYLVSSSITITKVNG